MLRRMVVPTLLLLISKIKKKGIQKNILLQILPITATDAYAIYNKTNWSTNAENIQIKEKKY